MTILPPQKDHLDPSRLQALHDHDILDTDPDDRFDEITAHVAEVCQAPVALVSLVAEDRQYFKSACGIDLDGTPISESVCVHALAEDEFLQIEDCTKDPRTRDNALVTGEMNLRFYAGAVLRTPAGHALGALCVLDTVPRRLTEAQKKTLLLMGRQVMRLLELRKALAEAEIMRREVDHRVKNSLQSISSLIKIRRRKATPEVSEALSDVDARIRAVSSMHESLYKSDVTEKVGLEEFLGGFHDQMRGLMPDNIEVAYDTDPVRLPARHAMSLAMIIAEFVSNSLKHGFPGDRAGRIEILGRHSDDGYELVLSDDGVGMPEQKTTGLGLQVISATAAQIEAEMLTLPPPEVGHRLALRLSSASAS